MQFDDDLPPQMDITPTPTLLEVLSKLDVAPWRCVAEFVDNSLDDFRRSRNPQGIVTIRYSDRQLIIADNGSGMTFDQLQDALKAGYSNKSKADDLGLFGIGFNVASACLGSRIEILTRKAGDERWHYADLDINKLRRAGTFNLQPRYARNVETEFQHGTIFISHLNEQQAQRFERAAFRREMANQLGRVYSYLLRASVPGLSGDCAGNSRNVVISINDEKVTPYLPCIWSEERSVTYQRETIQAVQKFNKELPDAFLCEDCGIWHNDVQSSTCSNCHSSNLITKSRRVWGWIGVQRYMDRVDFGIDFLRNGRAIMIKDQKVFSYKDPTVGEVYKDYPVEWPADMGRIVGEVHCDHVTVDFIKSSFIETDPNFRGVINIVRGNSSLQPKRATSENNSPMSKIFNGFRINEAGTRYLICGNGEKAIHQATKNWGRKFHEGDAKYITDEEWYKAAVAHDNIKNPNPGNLRTVEGIVGATLTANTSNTRSLGSQGEQILSPVFDPEAPIIQPQAAKPVDTIADRISKWKLGGNQRFDLSKTISLKNDLGSYDLDVYESHVPIVSSDGKPAAVAVIPIKGNKLFVVADPNSEQILKYGRSVTDLILFELAFQIKNMKQTNIGVLEVFSTLLSCFPDEERSENILKGRMSELRTRIAAKLIDCVAENPSEARTAVSQHELALAEIEFVATAKEPWSEMLAKGHFALYLSFGGIREIVDACPNLVFDGKLFKQHYASALAQVARERTQGYVSRALMDLAVLHKSAASFNSYEIQIAEVSLDFLTKSLRDD